MKRFHSLNQKWVSVGNYNVTHIRLGKGSSATVYLGYHKKTGMEVAVKKFEIPNNNSRIQKRVEREIQILQSLSHPYIIKMYEVVRDRVHNDIYLFMEYCPNGSIRSFLGKGGYLEENQANQIMKQLADALEHLYVRNIYHRDIKPHNLLLSKNYNLKLIDFGFSTLNRKGSFRRLCGSPMYMAPEILTSCFYDERSDIWSIGIVLYEILFGQHPFGHLRSFIDLTKYAYTTIPIKIPPDRRPPTSEPSVLCKHLLERMLVSNPRKRLSWKEFFNHPWLKTSIPESLDNSEEEIKVLAHINKKIPSPSEKVSYSTELTIPFSEEMRKTYPLVGHSSNTEPFSTSSFIKNRHRSILFHPLQHITEKGLTGSAIF